MAAVEMGVLSDGIAMDVGTFRNMCSMVVGDLSSTDPKAITILEQLSRMENSEIESHRWNNHSTLESKNRDTSAHFNVLGNQRITI